nr:NAD/NADP octopine/nopaline dehydrogenase family protein [Hoeflea prorocentri]
MDGVITPHVVRKSLALGVFPSENTAHCAALLGSILPIFDVKQDVLETNLESMNFLVHPAIALTGIGLFDVAKKEQRKIRFYQEGNSAAAGQLAEALDQERRPVLDRFGYPFRSLADQINVLYGGHGSSVQEAIHNAPFYHALPDLDPDIWRHWLSWDLPFAHIPFVRLSEMLGAPAPLHRGLVDILNAILGEDYWAKGLTLEALGLAGLSVEDIKTYLRSGNR